MYNGHSKIDAFDLKRGHCLAGKYVVRDRIGAGWEGEVYHVREKNTGIEKAAKLFYPVRNPSDKAVNFYAKKLDKLRRCDMVIRYHTRENLQFNGGNITALISEYVEGDILSDYIKRQPGKRLTVFEAAHLLHTLTRGVEQIHAMREYHGDLHDQNIIVTKVGLGYDVKLVDFYQWGRCTRVHMLEDVCSLIRIFYDAVGGPKRYAKLPPEAKGICLGLKTTLIERKFRTVTRLRQHLETMEWS